MLEKHPRRLPDGSHADPPERRLATPGGPGNAPRFPARTGTTAAQDPSPKHNESQRPPGRALAFRWSRTCRSAGHRPARAGQTWGVSCSRPERRRHFHRSNGRGHSPCHSATLILYQPGSKPPASARPAPGGRFAPAGSGAGLSWCLGRPIYRAPFRAGGGNAVRFLFPPGEEFSGMPALSGRGHRPCHSATLPLASRGPKPPASARPAPGGRFAPAGSGAGLSWCGLHRSWVCVPQGRGKRGSRFLVPPGVVKVLSPLHWQGPSPLPQRHAAPCQPGAKAPGQRPTRPRRALLARRVGRWPFVVRIAPVLGLSPAGAGERGSRFPRPKGQSLSPDREEFPGRQAVGLIFSTRLTRTLHFARAARDRDVP
jgi:hypothetical protein